MKKPVTVHAEIKRNWRNDKYALFYTDDFNIAELDYTNDERDKVRVYPAFHDDYFEYDSLKTALSVVEAITILFLAEKGYSVKEFDYPEELNEIKNEK